MTKKYGGFTGDSSLNPVSADSAFGAWQAPTEVFRQRTLNAWPLPAGPIVNSIGSITYAISSGVVDTSLSVGGYLLPSGQEVNRTTYSNLFTILNTTYGSGDTSTTFNLPNYFKDNETTLISVTTSGSLNTTNYLASGVLPTHTHTISNCYNVQWPSPQSNYGDPYSYANNSTFYTDFNGAAGNAGTRLHFTPMLKSANGTETPGTVVAVLIPDNTQANNIIPTNCLVADGSAVSRADYALLYSLVGDIYGSGDGSTTFNVPDLRGLFIHNTFDSWKTTPSGSVNLPSGYILSQAASHRHSISSAQYYTPYHTGGGSIVLPPDSSPTTFTSASSIGGSETRPPNISVLYAIIAK